MELRLEVADGSVDIVGSGRSAWDERRKGGAEKALVGALDVDGHAEKLDSLLRDSCRRFNSPGQGMRSAAK